MRFFFYWYMTSNLLCTVGKYLSFFRTLILDIQVRLANGDQAYTGRVEIRYQNMWGTVTSSNFLESEAKVFCTAMGMR